MKSLNKLTLIGNVGKDPEAKETVNGGLITTFSVATPEKWRSRDGQTQEHTEWHNCVAFGKTAEVVRDYVHKGSKLYLEGKLKTETWTGKDGQERRAVKVQVFNVLMLDGSKHRQQQSQRTVADDNDNVPF